MTTESLGNLARGTRLPRRRRRLVVTALLVPVLAACGGGSAGGESRATSASSAGNTSPTPASLVLYTCLSDELDPAGHRGVRGPGRRRARRPLPRSHRRAQRAGRGRHPQRAACAPTCLGLRPADGAGVRRPAPGRWLDAAGRRADPGGVPHRRLRRRPSAVHGGGAPHRRPGPRAPGPTWPAPLLRGRRARPLRGRLGARAPSAGSPRQPGYGVDFYRRLRTPGRGAGEHPGRRHHRRRPGRLRRGDDHGELRLRGEEAPAPRWTWCGRSRARSRSTGRSPSPRTAPTPRSRRTSSRSSSARRARPCSAHPAPTRPCPASAGPTIPAGAPVVSPDWAAIGAHKDTFLAEYQQVFGG